MRFYVSTIFIALKGLNFGEFEEDGRTFYIETIMFCSK